MVFALDDATSHWTYLCVDDDYYYCLFCGVAVTLSSSLSSSLTDVCFNRIVAVFVIAIGLRIILFNFWLETNHIWLRS